MKKVQNYFSYLKTSVLSTEELFELFGSIPKERTSHHIGLMIWNRQKI